MRKDKAYYKKKFKEALIKQVKALIFPVIILAIIVGAIIFAINYQEVKEVEEVVRPNAYEGDDKPIVISNDKLEFTFDPITTHFEVKVKSSGKVWKSNPEEILEGSVKTKSSLKADVNSTLVMSYVNSTGNETTYGNYLYGIENGIYEIESGKDFVKVRYSIGDVEKQYVIPPVCSVEDFESYLAAMNLDDSTLVKQYYKLYDINNLSKKDKEKEEELRTNYPKLEEEPLYVVRDIKENLKRKFETIFESIGYTYEQYELDKALDQSESSSEKPVFNITVVYRLDGDSLRVEIPMNEIEYRKDTPIYTLAVLPYFGAGSKQDEGKMLVPEGGGSIINFNNGKKSQSLYYANMYGWDMCLVRTAVVHNTRAYFNTFGIADNEGNSFLCTLEDGASYAGIQADISGKDDNPSCNYVCAKYSMIHREEYDVGQIANSAVFVFEQQLPEENIVQCYHFIDSNEYSDMAAAYQKYLEKKYGSDFKMEGSATTPVNLEIVTAVDKKKQILGLPVTRPLELTTFEEAQQVIEELVADGMKNPSVKLTGWCNGGVNQSILKSISTTSGLGGEKKLQNMIDAASNLGVNVYLNGITQYAYNSDIFDGFFSFTDAAKFLTKERAELFTFSDVTYASREGLPSYYLLHTDLALEMADNLIEKANELKAGVSFQDTGMDVSADYYRDNTVTRQATLNKQVEQMKAASDAGTKFMINMGNDYAMPYAKMITNMDLRGSGYTILDETIPFYQMAIHGYVDYTGDMLNVCGNLQEELLVSAEYGAGLAFSIMNETPFTLQKTLYTEYYGSEYDAWHDEIMKIYNDYNSAMGHVFNQKMVNHETLEYHLTCTTYEDGTKVYVNYNYEPKTVGNVTVEARSYKVVR